MKEGGFFNNMFGKKQEMVAYTPTDLENADKEYREAATALNTVDFGAEDFDEDAAAKIHTHWKQARDKYVEIHRTIHPEEYEGENATKVILPEVEMSQDAEALIQGGELAE
jgi:hypothetical protein